MMRILIVGGVAGGMSAAARARRLCEEAQIVVFEKGPYVSFASCGLPYYAGGEVSEEETLVLNTPDSLRERFNLDVRVNTEVTRIDRQAREIEARDLQTGAIFRETYDALVLAPGATPVRPPIPGIERTGHFTIRGIPDVRSMNEWVLREHARRAVVVGAGFIGLEMTEQLTRRGLAVSLVEAQDQVLSILDRDMAGWLHGELRANGVDLRLGDSVARFDAPGAGERAAASTVVLKSGERLPADVVILSLGVKPETALARAAGLEIGELGGIRVDSQMRTSDPHIWAVGDAVEARHAVTGEWRLIPLAGPAARQGRAAADSILNPGGKEPHAPANQVLGTGIVRLFGLTAAGTGADERSLKRLGIPHDVVHLHPNSHAGWYPGAETLSLKVLFAPDTGRVLGAQAVGRDGVDKRIDVLSTAIRAGLTVRDLAGLELAYAPPFGSARDPINLAGMIAKNALDGGVAHAQWHEIDVSGAKDALLLDVREPEEFAEGHIPGAVPIPLRELRASLNRLPRDREIIAYCRTGQRSYYACRLLEQRGFHARNLTGAYLTWSAARGETDAG